MIPQPFDGLEGLIDAEPCLDCGIPVPWNAMKGLCAECREREEEFEAERRSRPQTLADVGMCEADFR
jgi:hypothetical protein